MHKPWPRVRIVSRLVSTRAALALALAACVALLPAPSLCGKPRPLKAWSSLSDKDLEQARLL